MLAGLFVLCVCLFCMCMVVDCVCVLVCLGVLLVAWFGGCCVVGKCVKWFKLFVAWFVLFGWCCLCLRMMFGVLPVFLYVA